MVRPTKLFICLLLGVGLAGCEVTAPTRGPTASGGGTTPHTTGGSGGNDDPGGTDGGTISGGDGSGNGGDGGLIAHFKPALVVRATGCIMCHARVESTIITDFGHGNNYFFGAATPPGFSYQSGSIYGDHAQNWSSSRVWGQIVTPRATVAYGGIVESLAQYLRRRVASPDGIAPRPEVVEKDTVYIGAPTTVRLLELAGEMPLSHPEWKFFPAPGAEAVSGIEVEPSNRFVRNTPGAELVCSGDLFIHSVLFLNNVRLRTGNQGCRIYVTKSVFIQGAITYLGDASLRNLQITSARSVVLGMGPGAVDGGPNNTLRNRLQDFWTRFTYFTRDPSRSTQEKLDDIVNDGNAIPELRDATATGPHYRNLGFERLLLNAPNYQSRYQGEFKGVIIAEMAIASLGNFAFRFDPVFEQVPILPRLRPTDLIDIR